MLETVYYCLNILCKIQKQIDQISKTVLNNVHQIILFKRNFQLISLRKLPKPKDKLLLKLRTVPFYFIFFNNLTAYRFELQT